MMERVVPMGSSFFGSGTMAMRPVACLYLAWLPFREAKKETVLLKHADDFRGTEPFRHSPSPDRC